MEPSSGRSVPLPALLAALGGLTALVSLMLPWFSINTAALADLMAGIGLEKLTLPGMTPQDMQSNVNAGLEQMRAQMSADLVGYRTFHPITVGLQILGGLTALWVAMRIVGGDEPHTHSGALLGAALPIAGRPIYALVKMPGADTQATLGLSSPLLTAENGLYVSIGAGALLVLAVAAAAMRRSAAKSNAWTPPVGGVPGGAHVPMGLTGNASPSQAYAAAPSAYVPSGGYGEAGPSTLDRDSRLVRPNDPYAPPPLAAPAVPIMPAPAQVMPLHDPAPVTDNPGAIYGVPRPQAAPAAEPAPRPGSTAPPGFA